MKRTETIFIASLVAAVAACSGPQDTTDETELMEGAAEEAVEEVVEEVEELTCAGTVLETGECQLFAPIQIAYGDTTERLFPEQLVFPATRDLTVHAAGTHLARVPFRIERDGQFAEFYVENMSHEEQALVVNFSMAADGTLTIGGDVGGVVMNEASTWADPIEGVYVRQTERRSEADLWTRILGQETEVADGAWREMAPPVAVLPTDSISLERLSCYGSCPDYVVTLTGDGAVTFEGHRFTLHVGETTGTVDAAKVEELFAALRYLQPTVAPLNPDGTPGEAPDASCREVTDMATSVIRWTMDGNAQELVHYHGCNSYEHRRPLNGLEGLIDLTTGAVEWVGW